LYNIIFFSCKILFLNCLIENILTQIIGTQRVVSHEVWIVQIFTFLYPLVLVRQICVQDWMEKYLPMTLRRSSQCLAIGIKDRLWIYCVPLTCIVHLFIVLGLTQVSHYCHVTALQITSVRDCSWVGIPRLPWSEMLSD